jgi:hypothetical protein
MREPDTTDIAAHIKNWGDRFYGGVTSVRESLTDALKIGRLWKYLARTSRD